jgi:hypothetical protein
VEGASIQSSFLLYLAHAFNFLSGFGAHRVSHRHPNSLARSLRSLNLRRKSCPIQLLLAPLLGHCIPLMLYLQLTLDGVTVQAFSKIGCAPSRDRVSRMGPRCAHVLFSLTVCTLPLLLCVLVEPLKAIHSITASQTCFHVWW